IWLDYGPGYENALHYSSVFQGFAADLANKLTKKYDLTEGHIAEIGCGDGHMLDLMVQNGVKSAVGFDPSAPESKRGNVTIFSEYFVANRLQSDVSAILCRHVLEHLPDPLHLLADVRHAIGGRNCPVYFEVPNAEWMLESLSIWDVIYEHVTYWTIPAIRTLFRRAGFEPTNIEPGFGRQFLMIEAVPAEPCDDHCPQEELGQVISA
ncbi:MAG: class I SAM-dependent methyltransferase, partial [bacterium]|nr:class I SAM-dependent methyltransferase [bacterium]